MKEILNQRNVLPFKKRKIQINDKLNNELWNNNNSSHIVHKIIKQEGKNGELMKQNITTNKKIDTNIEFSANVNNLNSKTNYIEPKMLKNITNCSDHGKETNESKHSLNIEYSTDVKIENINSPQNFSSIDLGINLMESPQEIQCKEEKLYSCNRDTPNKKIKRNLCSNIKGFDELSNLIKIEFYDELNNMEPIDMMHDPNFMRDFFYSTMFNPMSEDDMALLDKMEVDLPFINIIDYINAENAMLLENKSNKRDTDVTYDHIKHISADMELTSDEVETSNEPSENAINALYNLNVQLMHKVPMQHRIEYIVGSRTLTKKEKELFFNHGLMKDGIFTHNEDKLIRNNWEAFCEAHNWNPKWVTPFIRMKNDYKFYIRSVKERQKFIQFLANGLPCRTLYSVYHRFRHLYGNHEKCFQRYIKD